MRFSIVSTVIALSQMAAAAGTAHGEGLLGNSMGPVDFMWPSSRPWSAETDNIAPCGSPSGVTKRTKFPISKGIVSLSIADDAWNVAFNLAVDENPISINSFQSQVVSNIAEIEPGHQCYLLKNVPSTVTAGTNATLQLKYWADYEGENNNERQEFYACADITFVDLADFDINPPCFNATASEFEAPASSSGSNSDSNSDNSSTSSSSSGGLSGGAKAGIAVGTIVASLAIVAGVAFFVFRRRRSAPSDAEAPARKEVREVSPDRVSRS